MSSEDHRLFTSRLSRPQRMLAVKGLLFVSLVLLVLGAFAPLLTTEKFYLFTNTFSLISGLEQLFVNEQVALALLIIAFSLCVPVLKALVMWIASSAKSADTTLVAVAEKVGKWSMLEVFIAALVIVAMKLGPVANADLHYGAYLLAASVLLASFASHVLSLDAERRAIFSGLTTLTLGAVIGAISATMFLAALNPGLFAAGVFAANAETRCVQRVVQTDRAFAQGSASEADYVAGLTEIDLENCPEGFRDAFLEYVEAWEALSARIERADNPTGIIDRIGAWVGLVPSQEEALIEIEEAWGIVTEEALTVGVVAPPK
jgi:paraquat-inducible protein A